MFIHLKKPKPTKKHKNQPLLAASRFWVETCPLTLSRAAVCVWPCVAWLFPAHWGRNRDATAPGRPRAYSVLRVQRYGSLRWRRGSALRISSCGCHLVLVFFLTSTATLPITPNNTRNAPITCKISGFILASAILASPTPVVIIQALGKSAD